MSIEQGCLLDSMVRELQLTESPDERYPLTHSFIELLRHLCSFPLPLTLGSGSRAKTGVTPYVEHALNVMLRLDSFSFKSPDEKWKIAISALSLINAIAQNYVASPDDFNPENAAIHPGFSIFKLLLTDSPLIRRLLQVSISSDQDYCLNLLCLVSFIILSVRIFYNLTGSL